MTNRCAKSKMPKMIDLSPGALINLPLPAQRRVLIIRAAWGENRRVFLFFCRLCAVEEEKKIKELVFELLD